MHVVHHRLQSSLFFIRVQRSVDGGCVHFIFFFQKITNRPARSGWKDRSFSVAKTLNTLYIRYIVECRSRCWLKNRAGRTIEPSYPREQRNVRVVLTNRTIRFQTLCYGTARTAYEYYILCDFYSYKTFDPLLVTTGSLSPSSSRSFRLGRLFYIFSR